MRLIDADALKKQFEEVYPLSTNEMGCIINNSIYDIIDNAPTVAPDMAQVLAYESGKANSSRPIGNWIKCDFHDFGARIEYNYKCTNCEAVYGIQYNYCPDCGAKMEEAEND